MDSIPDRRRPAPERQQPAGRRGVISDAADPVIQLDQPGVELLRGLAGSRTQFRVTQQGDGCLTLHPMSDHEAVLWRSGLVGAIAGGFSSPDTMIRLKADKL